MLRTTIAGSLPKPSWLADPGAQLFAPWVAPADRLQEAQDDAVRLALLDQEEAGIDIVSDGEQRRRHYIWGFLDGLSGTDTERLGRKRTRGGKYVAEQDDLNRVWAEYLGGHLPTTTTVEVSRLATHANCKLEISAIAVADSAPKSARARRRKRNRPS